LTYPSAYSKNKSLWLGVSLKEVDKNMIQRISLLAVCGLTLGLTAPSGWAETGDPGKGKAIYERQCGLCHGAQGKGDGAASQMMKPPAADLTGSKVKDKPDAELFQTIQNGRPPTAMPAFKGQLSDQQIHDVVAYIRSLGK
jgi:mono/diheme cytochrome c family protein